MQFTTLYQELTHSTEMKGFISSAFMTQSLCSC